MSSKASSFETAKDEYLKVLTNAGKAYSRAKAAAVLLAKIQQGIDVSVEHPGITVASAHGLSLALRQHLNNITGKVKKVYSKARKAKETKGVDAEIPSYDHILTPFAAGGSGTDMITIQDAVDLPNASLAQVNLFPSPAAAALPLPSDEPLSAVATVGTPSTVFTSTPATQSHALVSIMNQPGVSLIDGFAFPDPIQPGSETAAAAFATGPLFDPDMATAPTSHTSHTNNSETIPVVQSSIPQPYQAKSNVQAMSDAQAMSDIQATNNVQATNVIQSANILHAMNSAQATNNAQAMNGVHPPTNSQTVNLPASNDSQTRSNAAPLSMDTTPPLPTCSDFHIYTELLNPLALHYITHREVDKADPAV
ncbi:hypothetical protein NP233_g6509 [Leucocoprinus birnbaumii]|uniref:Uncharacterized protein n=1 Tax=Leucocoprinus birnbaumii TaxID=56174 RepID=A0AAD5VUF0_9AGAR|nr:hypothetical protein NP233_g6509 [Leucocoprinus birnbaumii]